MPPNAGDAGSFPGRKPKIPRATKPMHHNYRDQSTAPKSK